MRVSVIQMRSGLDPSANVDAAEAMIREAAGQGAAVVATPEMTTLVCAKPRRMFETLPDALPGGEPPEAARFEALARELGIHLLIGSMAVALDRRPGHRRAANRSLLFGPEGRVASYDKVHLFDVELDTGEAWKESSVYRAGEEAVVARAGEATLGLTICYDLRFGALYRRLAQAGADVLCVPAAFTVPTGRAHWEVLLRARAIETGSWVLAPAQGGGHEDGRVTYGHSMVVDPWGAVAARLDHDEPGVLVADIDLARSAEVRARVPALSLETNPALRTFGA